MKKPRRHYDKFGDTYYLYKGYKIFKSTYRKQNNGYSDWNGVSYPVCWRAINTTNTNYNFIGNTLTECLEEIEAKEQRRKTNEIRSNRI